MRKIFFILCLFLCFYAQAQTDKDNILITNKTVTYTFVQTKDGIQVKEVSSTSYESSKMGGSTPIAEFYNAQSTIDKVTIKGAKGVKPSYSMYQQNDLFYSDAKICYFTLPLARKGETADVLFEKTYKDPRYVPPIYFSESLFVKNKTITIIIPEWMNVELNERNFANNIKKEVRFDSKLGAQVYTYQITNEKAEKKESRMPGMSYIFPHVLLLVKSANINGAKITYFETLNDLYAWYRNIVKEVNNDMDIISSKAKEITNNYTNEEEKIKTLFAWVQDNIRYIAFEDGIAGFKPDDAQEVLRKKYGDCKGMANLLKALLLAEGFDARLAWVGTNRIAYDYSTPSLYVDNHMICALLWNGKTYYLDPTVKYMPLGEYHQGIQGRQVLVENEAKLILDRIESLPETHNKNSIASKYTIENGVLKEHALASYAGNTKQILLSILHSTPKNKWDEALKEFLKADNRQDNITDIQLTSADSQSKAVQVSYTAQRSSNIQLHDNKYFVDLNSTKAFSSSTIDTKDREHDICFPYKHYIVCNSTLDIPEGYTVSHIPENITVTQKQYSFAISYQLANNQLVYNCTIAIFDPLLKKDCFEQWNNDIRTLKNAYLEQVVLQKQ